MPKHSFLFMARYINLIVFLLLISTGGGAGAVEISDKALQAGFAPHKALYDIKLAGTKSGSQIVNISGQMLYEWQPSCDAWISNHRFNLLYEYADSPAMMVTSDFSTFETFDGESLEFVSQRKRDSQLFEELRGRAVLETEGGQASYTSPEGLELDLPSGTLFPMGHTLAVIEKIKQGKKFYKAVIFDGSDEEGPVEVNAFIGKRTEDKKRWKGHDNMDAQLLEEPSRNVRLAFFPLSSNSSTSDYEMSLIFHDNGVISEMYIEYDDFSVIQELIALESLPGTCKPEEAGADP